MVSVSDAVATPLPLGVVFSSVPIPPLWGMGIKRRPLPRQYRAGHRGGHEQEREGHDAAIGALAGGERVVAADPDRRNDHRERREDAAADVVRRLRPFFGGERDQRRKHGRGRYRM